MKCEDNDGCPFRGDGGEKLEGYCLLYGEVGVSENTDDCGEDNGRLESYFGCHLGLEDFQLLREMLGREHYVLFVDENDGEREWQVRTWEEEQKEKRA